MADALEQLKERLGEVMDLYKVVRLLSWDQQTMMPPAGTRHRADQMATVQQLAHELFIDPEVGRLLDELQPLEESLDPDSDDASLIRVARRDYEKDVNVPASLRAEMARAAAEARPVWVKAKAESDFASFLPSLERIVELKLEYVDCVADGAAERYDVLLDDYESQTTTAEVRTLFEELKPPLVELIAELRERDVDDSFLHGDFPPDRQRALALEVIDLFGHRPDSWRIDPTEHPFASGPGRDDVRITTNYHPDSLESLFSTMHEYGHGLYSHQLPQHLERLPIGQACSLGIHESQSRLWENLVGRSLPFWRLFYPRLQETYPEQFGERRPRALPRRHPRRQAEPDPHPGRRGDLRDARHAPLRARAGHRGGARRAARPATALEREDVGLPRRRGPRRRARRASGRPLVGRVDRLLLDLPDRDGGVGADLAGGEPRPSRALQNRSAAASSRRCASGWASTSTRSAASSRRRRRYGGRPARPFPRSRISTTYARTTATLSAEPAGRAGARVADGTRTRGHRDHNPELYQLSYRHRARTA